MGVISMVLPTRHRLIRSADFVAAYMVNPTGRLGQHHHASPCNIWFIRRKPQCEFKGEWRQLPQREVSDASGHVH